MSVKISERFATQCQVVYHNNFDTCGTITRSSIEYLTPAQLESLFTVEGLFADLDAWFKTSIEMKACGTRTYGLYDWIMSGADRTQAKLGLFEQKVMKNPSVMFPFILGYQESVINTDFWAITGGAANSAYTGDLPATAIGTATSGPLTAAEKALGAAGDRVIRVVSRYGVEMDEKWFNPGVRVHIMGRSGIGVAQDGQWKILASSSSTDRSYVDVLVTSENAGSSQVFATAPTSGVLLIGVNNVNDFEKWCNNMANFDGRKEVPFWYQTMRRTRCVDDLYKEYYARLTTAGVNEAFKRFGDLTIAQRNAQDEVNWQKAFVNAFFFNKPISVNQTASLWKNLDNVTTPTGFTLEPVTGGKVITKRANFVGVKEQLRQCDRYRDLQGNTLNFYEFLDENYRIMRARRSQGKAVTDIDWFTDSVTAANMISAYTAYLKNEYGAANVQFPIDITKSFKNDLGFVWRSMVVKYPAGVSINIISHEFFDDYRDAHKTENIEAAGTLLLALEFGRDGIHWAQLASNRVVHRVGALKDLAPIDRDWACVMETLTEEITLTSETGTVIVPCPQNNLWITNFADTIPSTAGKSLAGGGSYEDLY